VITVILIAAGGNEEEYWIQRELQEYPKGVVKGWVYPVNDNCWNPIGVNSGKFPSSNITASHNVIFASTDQYIIF